MPCNSEQHREQKTVYLCVIRKLLQCSATTDRTLVAGAGQRFESARRLSYFSSSQSKRRSRNCGPVRDSEQTWPTIAQRGALAEAAAVRRAICGPVCLFAPSIDGSVGSLLLPVRDAAASLAHEAHATVLGDYDRHRSGQRSSQPVGRTVAGAHVPGPLFGDLLAFEIQRPPHALDVRQPARDHAAEAQELVVLAHDHRAVGRRKACDQVSSLEERLVERLYFRVGRHLELSPTYGSRLVLIGGTVKLG